MEHDDRAAEITKPISDFFHGKLHGKRCPRFGEAWAKRKERESAMSRGVVALVDK